MAHYRALRAVATCRDNSRVQRHRAAFRLTSWLFVAALLLKSAVPLLASTAAGLQGRATAEVCDVYGVDTSTLGTRSRAAVVEHAHAAHHGHHGHHAEGGAAAPSSDGAPAHGPASRVSHGGDHCALSALAFAVASGALAVAPRPATALPVPAAGATATRVADAAARWAAQLRHAPPASS